MKTISKFLGTFFLLPAITTVSRAQITGAIDQEWVAFFGDLPDPSSTLDTIKFRAATAIDVNGNVHVTGFVNKQQGFTPGETRFATIKYSKGGDTLWVREFGNLTPGVTSIPLDIVVDASGDIYVTGVTNASGTADMLTVKYDASGIEQWAKTFDEGAFDQANAIARDDNGNIYVTGVSENISGDLDFFTVKYDPNGNDLWDMRFDGDGNNFDQAKAIAVSGDSVYVTGESTGSGTALDYVTICYNAISGNEEWSVSYNGSAGGVDQPADIAVDGQKNVFVTGRSRETGNGFDLTTVKYNSSGIQQWVNNFHRPGSDADEGFALVVDQQGNVYVTGTSGTGFFEFPRTGVQINFDILDFDYITIKYNSAGVQQWMQSFDGPAGGIDGAFDIALDTNGNVYVTGLSQSTLTLPAGFSFSFGVDFVNAAVVIGSGVSIVSSDPAPPVNVGTGPADATTIKYDNNGNQQWVARFNNPEPGAWSGALGIEVDENASVYVAGFSALIHPVTGTSGVRFTTIKYSTPIEISVTATDETCEAAGEGAIDLSVTGGTAPYSFVWSNEATTEDIDSLDAGDYFVTVTDTFGKMRIDTVTINDPVPDPNDPPSCGELFISEYCEGTGQNNAIELFNPTNGFIGLNRYFLRLFINGAPTPLIIQLVGKIRPQGTFVIAHPNADQAILNIADQTSNILNYDGDDPVQIVKVLNEININLDSIQEHGGNPHAIFDTLQFDTLDHVGEPGVRPGNDGYPVGSGSTKDHSLKRKFGVTKGVEDWTCGQKQWNVMEKDDVAGLGSHESRCKVAASKIQFAQASSTFNETAGLILIDFDYDGSPAVAGILNSIRKAHLDRCIDPVDLAKCNDDYFIQGANCSNGQFSMTVTQTNKSIAVIIQADFENEGMEGVCFEISEVSGALMGEQLTHVLFIEDSPPPTGLKGSFESTDLEIHTRFSGAILIINGFMKGRSNIYLFDMLGKAVRNEVAVNQANISLNLNNLTPGIYLLRISAENGSLHSEKLIVR